MKACSNSIEGTEMEEEDMIDGVEVVSSGVSELSRLQSEENFSYIKP
jgi:intracellular sulfur oxidation DsrE/DsrF family protein